MKPNVRPFGLVAVAATLLTASACGPKQQTEKVGTVTVKRPSSDPKPAAKATKGAKTGKDKATAGAKGPAASAPVVAVTRASSSSNPQAVASLKEAVELLTKIRREGSGSYDTVIARLEGATALDSNFAEAWYNLGVVYEDLGKYDKA